MQKVVVIGQPIEDSFEWHINETLNYMGHQSQLIDCFLGDGIIRETVRRVNYIDQLPNIHWKLILKRILSAAPDLVIVSYRDFNPLLVKKIKALGICTIHINPDTITTLNRQAVFAEAYDFYFVKSNYMLDFMKTKLNLNTFKYVEAFNPQHLISTYKSKQEAEEKESIEVMMYGSYYPSKSRMIKVLSKEGIQFTTYGPKGFYFPKELLPIHTGQYLVGENKADKIFGSKLIFNNLTYGEIDSLNCRFFEVIGAGGVQVVDIKDDLKEIYSKEYMKYIAYHSVSEVKSKIDFLLKEDSLRYEISAYNKLLSVNYTYEKMLSKILGTINL